MTAPNVSLTRNRPHYLRWIAVLESAHGVSIKALKHKINVGKTTSTQRQPAKQQYAHSHKLMEGATIQLYDGCYYQSARKELPLYSSMLEEWSLRSPSSRPWGRLWDLSGIRFCPLEAWFYVTTIQSIFFFSSKLELAASVSRLHGRNREPKFSP